ncbi:MAG: type II toxin-antitoxin system HicB family antitoxin [Bradyrhizobium sp.]
MAIFVAVVRKQGEAAYAASFPDFPGLAVDGQTLDELLAKAGEVLTVHVESLLEAGKTIGIPTPAEAIERRDALLLAAIEIPDDLGLTNVSLEIPALTLARIDAFARRQGLTRSALFVHAVNRLEMEGLLPRDRRGAISDGPTLFDFVHPLELKVEAVTTVYPPLQAPAETSAGERIADGIEDIAAELERLVERSSASKRDEVNAAPPPGLKSE